MIAEQPPPAGPESITPSHMKGMALFLVLPFYLLIGGLVRLFAGPKAILPEAMAFPVFGILCVAGLACMMISFRIRRDIVRRGKEGKTLTAPTRAAVFGLSLSETPAFLGLIYFVLFRDWVGFLILLGGSYLGFILHARR